MRPSPQNLVAAGAFCPVPSQKQLALVASLVTIAVITAVLLSGSFVCKADMPARH